MKGYIALVHKDEGTSYGVSFSADSNEPIVFKQITWRCTNVIDVAVHGYFLELTSRNSMSLHDVTIAISSCYCQAELTPKDILQRFRSRPKAR